MSPFHFQSKQIGENSAWLHDREETHSFVKVEEVIGRDRESDEIVKMLVPKDNSGEDQKVQNLSVISVIGFGGLGKTTLAQLVYNDKVVQSGFDMCLWACINYLSDLKQVLMTILTSILKKKPEDNSLDQLQQKLRQNIRGKKYLLVLDDVWDEDASNWLKLKTLLSCGKNGSKVLVTTRSKKVAECLDAIKPYYQLSVLSEESAWGLFVKMAFEESELSSSDSGVLVPLGKEIVRKCGYVPLAIVTIGRMLRYKEKEKRSWLSFLEKELPEVLSGDGDLGNANIMQVLKFSYNDLPPSLKHCFAYCSLFPKDYTFDKDMLVHLWIAQGFIVPHGEKSLEEVGDDYFFHMADRCFFQEVKMYRTWDGCLRYTCRMHDLVHDLVIQVAGNECSCFVENNLDKMGEKTTHRRHISLICNPNSLLDHSSMSSQSKTLRTLLFCNSMNLRAKCLDSFFASFKMLHALQLSYLDLETLPDSIGELIHLRYIDLTCSMNLKFLPNSICKLHHLQTLILDRCRELKELPSKLGKLVSLRHLILSECWGLDSLPSGLAALTSLVTLDRLIVHHRDGGLRYLSQLDNLCGVLGIELSSSSCVEDARQSNMSRKHKLNGMSINWKTDSEAEMENEEANDVLEQLEPNKNLQYLKIEWYGGDTLSDWFSSLSNLKKLVLQHCSLEYLDISCARSGSSLFPCLEILEMRSLCNLKGWWRELGDNAPMSILPCLPRVSKVVIEDCPHLIESMPLFSREIIHLELSYVSGKLVSKLLSIPDTSSSECHHYSKLQVLDLNTIEDLKCLPEVLIRHLTVLKSLTSHYCGELSWVSSRGLAYLTFLEELKINGKIVRLEDTYDEKMSMEVSNGLGMMPLPWRALQRLRRLEVHWQSHLQEGLQYLTSLEELKIEYYEANQVEADNEDTDGIGLLCKLGLLERLHTLRISFKEIQCTFPKWIQYLRFLKHLTLSDCEELMSMSWGILVNMSLLRSFDLKWVRKVSSIVDDDSLPEQQTQFNSVVQLHIEHVEDGEWIHDIPWRLLPSLRILTLYSIQNLSLLPGEIQNLTSLQELNIQSCNGIEAIPNWMINLASLQQLSITHCSPKLAERCDPETGAD